MNVTEQIDPVAGADIHGTCANRRRIANDRADFDRILNLLAVDRIADGLGDFVIAFGRIEFNFDVALGDAVSDRDIFVFKRVPFLRSRVVNFP